MTMPERDIANILHGWLQRERENAPTEDPRRTPECLRFAEIPVVARDPNHPFSRQRQKHIAQCAWCQRAVEIAKREESAQSPRPQELASSIPAGRLPASVVAQIADWIRASVAANPETDSPASFDSEGTLHIRLTHYPSDGPVRIRLVVNDLALHIGNTVVAQGNLSFSRQMPEFGLRDLQLPSATIEIQALPSAA